MYKKIISLLLCAAMLITVFPVAFASENRNSIASGFCGEDGENLTWTLYDDGELVISGEGKMDWYNVKFGYKSKLPPWFNYYDRIDVITVEEGVTTIGNDAFSTGFKSEEYGPTSYYKINLPKSLEFVEGNMFYEIEVNRIPGQHLAYCYAGTESEWKHVLMKTCSITFSEDGSIDRVYGTGSVYNFRPEGKFEKLYFNGEEPESFCEIVRYYGEEDIDLVAHYYAPDAAKLVWFSVYNEKETHIGEIPAGEYIIEEMEIKRIKEGDLYLKTVVVDENGNTIAASENFLLMSIPVDNRTFGEKVSDFFAYLNFSIFFFFFFLILPAILSPITTPIGLIIRAIKSLA